MSEAEKLRLECLRLALGSDASSQEVVACAQVYFDFVAGTNDAEVLRAARDLAKKVTG